MRNDDRKKLPWMVVLLVVGHLTIIAGLAASALAPRKPSIKPSLSILEGVQQSAQGLLQD